MSGSEKDFFISYTSADRVWAEWIAWCLEQAGYTVIIQAWDFPPGSNFVYEMDNALKQAQRVVAVLSPTYLISKYAFSEWAVVFRSDPQGKERHLLPVRVEACETEGLLGPIVYCDLVECSEKVARERLWAAARGKQAHPASVPFPGIAHTVAHHPRFPGSLPPIWNIPYPRNPVFTGREEILERIESQLQAGQAAALSQPHAISGLGGIGKTQIAVEYAYRYRDEYQAVLWIGASTHESLVSGYTALARLFNLPEKDAQEEQIIIEAVKTWLQTHGAFLLILDNADNLEIVREFVPTAFSGHLLLTTQAQTMGRLARRIEVETMSQDVGALFLLRRAGKMSENAPLDTVSPTDATLARSICEELGGLPLALDQAGAFIEETQCSLSDYRERYQTHRSMLLKRRGGFVVDHPESVARTWALSFEKIEECYPIAADLLQLCAFLHPDAIPLELIIQGAGYLGPTFATLVEDEIVLDEAIATLGAYSLIRRNGETRTLSIHRLVQAVLRDGMDKQMRHLWAERAVQVVNDAFSVSSPLSWFQAEQYLLHCQVCTGFWEGENEVLPQAESSPSQAGWDLREQVRLRYDEEADSLIQHELALRQDFREGLTRYAIANSLSLLGYLYEAQGRFAEAELLYRRTLAFRERQLGDAHLDTATSLHNLAVLCQKQGKYTEAEPLFLHAVRIYEHILGTGNFHEAFLFLRLASLYQAQGKYAEAESLSLRALRIYERILGPKHLSTTATLQALANLYLNQDKHVEAESLDLRISEQSEGPKRLDTCTALHELARLYQNQGKYTEAESLFLRILRIYEHALERGHPRTATVQGDYASLLRTLGRIQEAELLEMTITFDAQSYEFLRSWREQMCESDNCMGRMVKNEENEMAHMEIR